MYLHINYELTEWRSVLYTFMSSLFILSIHHSIDLIGFDVHWLLHDSWPFRNLCHLAQLWCDSSRRGGFFHNALVPHRWFFAMPKFQFGAQKLWDEISGYCQASRNLMQIEVETPWKMEKIWWDDFGLYFLDGIFTRPRSLHESRLELGGKWEDFVGRLKLISKLANAYKCIRSLELSYIAAVKHWTKSCS